MRLPLHFFVLPLLVACGGHSATSVPTTETKDTLVAVPDTNTAMKLMPLTGSGVRFDGVYFYADHNLHYYMRFFERGSAAFVGGTENKQGELATMLTVDVPSGWNQVHNCPVVQHNDSLFIHSVGIKGAINYLGDVRANGDSVRFLKASEITGTRVIAAYSFVPDPSSK